VSWGSVCVLVERFVVQHVEVLWCQQVASHERDGVSNYPLLDLSEASLAGKTVSTPDQLSRRASSRKARTERSANSISSAP
jgi:hypothetical protein